MEKSKSGETIVEVLVSAVIFLLLMAVLQGAVMFSHSAQQKSGRLRENDAAMLQALQGAEITPNSEESSRNYQFYAYNADETKRGDVVIQMEANLGKKDVSYEDTEGNTQEAHFSVFGGGDAP